MASYIEVEDAIPMSGLRVVLTPSVPGPWSEAAKAILCVKKLEYIKVRQELLGTNLPLIRWTAQATAPSMVYNDEPPRSTWMDQLFLLERLAPTPALIPSDLEQRMRMFGLAIEIMSENGFIWNRRVIMVRDYAAPDQPAETRELYALLGRKYGYTPAQAETAVDRCVEVMNTLAQQLHAQRKRGSEFFIGDSLTALDLYWATAAVLVRPLPEPDCPMPAFFRDVYTVRDDELLEAADPILLSHREMIYRRYLELPIDV